MAKKIKTTVHSATKQLNEEKNVAWDFTKTYVHEHNKSVNKHIKEIVCSAIGRQDRKAVEVRMNNYFDSRKRKYKEDQRGMTDAKLSKNRRYTRWCNLTLRRYKTALGANGNHIPNQQKEDLLKVLEKPPERVNFGSCLVSSDESDMDEAGNKIFIVKAIPNRSRFLQSIMRHLDDKCNKKLETNGTSMFQRITGNNVSIRTLPENLPAWMSNSDI